ncbi:MAG: hypothetical protein R3270_09470 [Gammaproteobacteria bacterium]|nr:hypothetical protein [Gammaproteobacteria bacterium]
MTSEIDKLEQSRRRMLAGFGVAFLVWQLPEILVAIIPLPGWAGPAFSVAAIAGVLGFLYYGWRMMSLAGRLADEPELSEGLYDERVRGLRDRAFVVGFWTLLVYIAFLHAFTLFFELHAVAAWIRLGLVIGVVVPITTFLVLDRDDDNGE